MTLPRTKNSISDLFILIVIALSFSAPAFSFSLPEQRGSAELDAGLIEYFERVGQGGILITFIGDPELRASEKQATYWMEKKGDLSGTYFMYNLSENELDMDIVAMIDYKQVETSVNGESKQKVSLKLRPNEKKEFNLTIPDVSNGAHDLLLLAFMKNVSEKEGDRKIASEVHSIPLRANIFVGSREFVKISCLKPEQSNVSQTSHDYLKPVRNMDTEKGTILGANIINSREETAPVMVLAFDESYQQIQSDELGYQCIEPNKFTTVAMTKNQLKSNKVIIARVEAPYSVLEPERGELAQIDTFVRAVAVSD